MEAETFWPMVGALGQIAAAIATFAAVGVSLWIALSERRPKVSLSVKQWVFIGDIANDKQIGFQVINQGLRPVTISSYGWRTGRFKKQNAVINHSQDHPLQPQLPCTIEPGQRVTFLNNPAVFAEVVREKRDFFSWSLGRRRVPRKLEGMVHLAYGTSVHVRVSKDIRELVKRELRENLPDN